eukprot:gene9554-biopygen9512
MIGTRWRRAAAPPLPSLLLRCSVALCRRHTAATHTVKYIIEASAQRCFRSLKWYYLNCMTNEERVNIDVVINNPPAVIGVGRGGGGGATAGGPQTQPWYNGQRAAVGVRAAGRHSRATLPRLARPCGSHRSRLSLSLRTASRKQ